jgi:hypothetical protein
VRPRRQSTTPHSAHVHSQGHSPVHVRLTGLPRTSTPADITRLLARNNVHNITNGEHAMFHQAPTSDLRQLVAVALDYYRFEPTGRAFLTLTQPSVLPKVLAALKQLRFFGHPLIPRTTKPPPEPRMRSRGLKGREEASERSIISGTGSQGGITDVGRSVMLSGMPGKISTEALRRFLNNYSLMGGQGEVVKIDS